MSEEAVETASGPEEAKEGPKLTLVRPKSPSDDDMRAAAEALFEALTGRKGKVTRPRQGEEEEAAE